MQYIVFNPGQTIASAYNVYGDREKRTVRMLLATYAQIRVLNILTLIGVVTGLGDYRINVTA